TPAAVARHALAHVAPRWSRVRRTRAPRARWTSAARAFEFLRWTRSERRSIVLNHSLHKAKTCGPIGTAGLCRQPKLTSKRIASNRKLERREGRVNISCEGVPEAGFEPARRFRRTLAMRLRCCLLSPISASEYSTHPAH